MKNRRTQPRRLIRVNDANILNEHLYINEIADLFPSDSLGPASGRHGTGRVLRLDINGLPDPVHTDIPTDAKSGRSRGFFRKRAWVGQFFRFHGIRSGDFVAIERKADHHYSVDPVLPKQKFRVAEFFAGIGLVRLALERRGFRVVFANDIDAQKFRLYRENFGDTDFCLGDIHSLKPGDIPNCDVYTASFPCNDLSIAGAMAGLKGSQSSAFWGLIRLIKQRKRDLPSLVLIENVPGFLMSNGGKDFKDVLLALNRLGYACDALVIDAVEFSPQSRARIFVIAQRGVSSNPPDLIPSPFRPMGLVNFMRSHPEIRWSTRDIPSPPVRKPCITSILENMSDHDPMWWSKERTDYFMDQLSERHAKTAAEMIKGTRFTYATAFRRVRRGRSMAELRTDGIAGCLRTPRGGSGRQILFKAGKRRRWVRLLTGRECARLQGVPDSYRIPVPLNQALFGFGDAVCVPVVEWLAEHYLFPALEDHAQTKTFHPYRLTASR